MSSSSNTRLKNLRSTSLTFQTKALQQRRPSKLINLGSYALDHSSVLAPRKSICSLKGGVHKVDFHALPVLMYDAAGNSARLPPSSPPPPPAVAPVAATDTPDSARKVFSNGERGKKIFLDRILKPTVLSFPKYSSQDNFHLHTSRRAKVIDNHQQSSNIFNDAGDPATILGSGRKIVIGNWTGNRQKIELDCAPLVFPHGKIPRPTINTPENYQKFVQQHWSKDCSLPPASSSPLSSSPFDPVEVLNLSNSIPAAGISRRPLEYDIIPAERKSQRTGKSRI